MVVSQCSPIWPAPTWTSRSRRPSSGMVAKRMGSAFGRTTVVLSVEEVVGVVAQQRGRRAFGTQGVRPADAVGDDPADVFVVVHGVILVAGAEVEDLAVSAAEGAAAADDFAAAEPGDEDQLVGCWDVEEFAVHLLF